MDAGQKPSGMTERIYECITIKEQFESQERICMRRTIVAVLIIGMSLGVTACSDRKTDPLEGKKAMSDSKMSAQGATGEHSQGMIDVLKQKTLPDYPSVTIGKAFDAYSFFKKKEWRESRSNGKIYIDFIGVLDNKKLELLNADVTLQTVNFKFVIMDDGQFGLVLVSVDTLMKNVTNQTVIADVKAVLAKIYANEEIKIQFDK